MGDNGEVSKEEDSGEPRAEQAVPERQVPEKEKLNEERREEEEKKQEEQDIPSSNASMVQEEASEEWI